MRSARKGKKEIGVAGKAGEQRSGFDKLKPLERMAIAKQNAHEVGLTKGNALDEQAVEKIMAKDAQKALAYYFRGITKYEVSDFEGALEDLNKAIGLNPVFADAYDERSKVRKDMNSLEGGRGSRKNRIMALQDYAMARKLKPELWDPEIEQALGIKKKAGIQEKKASQN
jgi:tetratricopeptide (TPR) repeat protein